MDRTLGEWGRKGRGHWVNGVEKPIISDRPVLQVINTSRPTEVGRFRTVRIMAR